MKGTYIWRCNKTYKTSDSFVNAILLMKNKTRNAYDNIIPKCLSKTLFETLIFVLTHANRRQKMKLFFIVIFGATMTSVLLAQSVTLDIAFKNGSSKSIFVENIYDIYIDNLSTEVLDNSNSVQIIKSLALFQNYPNPFNPTTTISYKLDKPGNVDIRILPAV